MEENMISGDEKCIYCSKTAEIFVFLQSCECYLPMCALHAGISFSMENKKHRKDAKKKTGELFA
ncbi:MAG: hypothetical protein ABFR75_05465 [Acidobacteriota bacterium]